MVSLSAASDPPPANAAPASEYTTHRPIDIRENRRFLPSQGVIGGSGTETDPFIIEGWAIDAPSGQGIQIRFTDAHFIIRNVSIRTQNVGVALSWVTNAQIENVSVLASFVGIALGAVANVVARNNNLTADFEGISVCCSSSKVTLRNNVLWESSGGLTVRDSLNITVAGNTLFGSVAPSFYLLGARNVTLSDNKGGRVSILESLAVEMVNNRFAAPGLLLTGRVLPHFNSHTITADNLIDDRPLLYHKNCNSVDLDGVGVAQVFMANCRNVRVASLTSTDFITAIQLAFVSEAAIASNILRARGGTAIDVVQSSLITIVGNDIRDSETGVRVWDSERISIAGNTVANNSYGISARDSSYMVVTNNTLHDNLKAILLGVSRLPTPDFGWVTLQDNLIYFNEQGIWLAGVKRVSIIANRIVNNAEGVLVTFGASGVVAHHNDFVGGGVEIDRGYHELENVWDAGWPEGGNYWSSYRGADHCSGILQARCPDPDGIGDAPFFVGANDVDRYPLVSPHNSNNTPPTAAFTISPESGGNMTTFELHASASLDLEDALGALQIRWDWENDGVWDTGWSIQKTIKHQWADPGTYTVRMQIRDTEGLFDITTREVFVCFSPDCRSPDPLILGILVVAAAGWLLFILSLARRQRFIPRNGYGRDT